MLYDPRHEYNPQKPDIFALDTLIGWLEQQPPTKLYRYNSPGHCLLAQYFTAMTVSDGDVPVVSVSRQYIHMDCDNFYLLPKGWDAIAGGLKIWRVHSFKSALRRAKRLRAKAAVGSILSRIPQYLGLT